MSHLLKYDSCGTLQHEVKATKKACKLTARDSNFYIRDSLISLE